MDFFFVKGESSLEKRAGLVHLLLLLLRQFVEEAVELDFDLENF